MTFWIGIVLISVWCVGCIVPYLVPVRWIGKSRKFWERWIDLSFLIGVFGILIMMATFLDQIDG